MPSTSPPSPSKDAAPIPNAAGAPGTMLPILINKGVENTRCQTCLSCRIRALSWTEDCRNRGAEGAEGLGSDARDMRTNHFVSDSCDFVDELFVPVSCGFVDELFVPVSWINLSCPIRDLSWTNFFVDKPFRAFSLKKVPCTASVFYDFSPICDIFF